MKYRVTIKPGFFLPATVVTLLLLLIAYWLSNGVGGGVEMLDATPYEKPENQYYKISMGIDHTTVVIKMDGSLWAWGRNISGERCFDVERARMEGYKDDEILQYLARDRNYGYERAHD